MEYFYREMRRRTGFLMEGGKPVGGQWNLDRENRKALPRGHRPPRRLRFAPDAITAEVMALVAAGSPTISATWSPLAGPSPAPMRCGRWSISWTKPCRSSAIIRTR